MGGKTAQTAISIWIQFTNFLGRIMRRFHEGDPGGVELGELAASLTGSSLTNVPDFWSADTEVFGALGSGLTEGTELKEEETSHWCNGIISSAQLGQGGRDRGADFTEVEAPPVAWLGNTAASLAGAGRGMTSQVGLAVAV